jgi:MFS family permease
MSTDATRQSNGLLVALALCMALQMTGLVMLQPLFALRFESFGAGVKALGVSTMAYALTSTIAAPFIGMLADRFGRRPIILVSLAAHVFAFSGYLFAAAPWELILLRGLAGIFTAGLIPAMTSIIGDLAPETRRGHWIGIVNGGASAGWIVGPLLGGLLYDRFGFIFPFAASIAMAFGAFLMAAFRIPETHTTAAHPSQPHSVWTLGLQALPARSAFILLLIITFGVMFAWAFIEPQFMFYAYDDLRWTSSQLGLVMSAYGVAFMLGEFVLGQLSDRLGRKPVIITGLVLFSAQFIGLAFFRNGILIAAAFVIAGMGNALYDPALSASILDISPVEHRSRILGIKSMVGSFGSILGPALVALLNSSVDARSIFLIAAGVVLLATLTGLTYPASEPYAKGESGPDIGTRMKVSHPFLKGEL